jgi:hypothetical protein
VKEACSQYLPEESILLLPLDLVGPYSHLEDAAEQASQAFGGQGLDYVVHNAGATGEASAGVGYVVHGAGAAGEPLPVWAM